MGDNRITGVRLPWVLLIENSVLAVADEVIIIEVIYREESNLIRHGLTPLCVSCAYVHLCVRPAAWKPVIRVAGNLARYLLLRQTKLAWMVNLI